MSLSLQQTATIESEHPANTAVEEPMERHSLQDVLAFAKEMMAQKPSRGLLKVYLVGSVFAVLGTLIGLAELVCRPLSSGEPLDAEMVLIMMDKEQRTQKSERKVEETLTKEHKDVIQSIQTFSKSQSQRNLCNRLHAS
ncbi:G0/G1 switch protein 2 [Nerophis ophidion]|uniref:G0/G1 switch protein 2 n=1 Tax=Nerophis ophidion TaxID=159077 RepID=UPI002ADF8F5E|nr:G0/G1 switch protein 2 [Nerophis ophidion]